MKTIGIIGAGAMGFAEARVIVAAGYKVILSGSRAPEFLKEKVAMLGANASADTPEGTATKSDILLIALPYEYFDTMPLAKMQGKIAILVSNHIYDGSLPEVENKSVSFATVIAKKYPGIRWVRALNNLNSGVFTSLPRKKGDPERSAVPVASDDEKALAEVSDLIQTMGFDTVELNTLKDSLQFEPMTPAFGLPYLRYPEKLQEWLAGLNGRREAPPFDPGRTVTIKELKELLSQWNK